MQREEARIMTDQTRQTIPTENIQVILKEILRGELASILRVQDNGPSFDDTGIDSLITRLDQRRADLKRSARRSDYGQVETEVREAATSVGFSLPADLPNDLGRRAVNLVRDLLELEGNALDGEDARSEATPLVAQYSNQSVETFVASKAVLLSTAWDEALKLYPSKDMKGNIDAIGKLAIVYFGDIPIETVSKDKQKAFFVWMGRLPKNHGRKHGKNRHCRDAPKNPEKYNRTKHDEIADADAADDAVIDEVRAKNSISNVEKRALLSERLTPRLTLTTLRRNRDGLNRLFKAAIELGCKEPPAALTYKEVESAVKAAAPDDPLYVRVTKPKIRMPWSEERLAAFLTSPLYTGCFSKHRRARPGTVIIRDSLYWVPLIVLTIGSRIEEILILKRRNLVRRNGVSCLNIGLDPDQGGKTEDSQRVIPIPQLLLDLGFDDWVRDLDEEHGPLLFPDAVKRATTSDITSPFSKALNRILTSLGLGDFDEDFYAMRKTLSSMLGAADVQEGQRQAIAGHRNGSILTRHYTAHRTRDLKTAVDKADFQLQFKQHPALNFPVITSCGLASSQLFSVDVVLDDRGEAETISVTGADTTSQLFSFERLDPLTGKDRGQQAIRDAARTFKELVGDNSMTLPRNALKRAAVEHFHALA
jgi:integrase